MQTRDMSGDEQTADRLRKVDPYTLQYLADHLCLQLNSMTIYTNY